MKEYGHNEIKKRKYDWMKQWMEWMKEYGHNEIKKRKYD